MNEVFYAYHVVTERPMEPGQQILMDADHPNGVYHRVMEKRTEVEAIWKDPDRYDANQLEHHTRVALRELALEQVRQQQYDQYPSRMCCLYVSRGLKEARQWAEWFVGWGRPTFSIVRLKIEGNSFAGDANNCFDALTDYAENLRLAARYWENLPNLRGEPPIEEILASGRITVDQLVEQIGCNLK